MLHYESSEKISSPQDLHKGTLVNVLMGPFANFVAKVVTIDPKPYLGFNKINGEACKATC